MTEKRVIERLTDIMSLLINRDCEDFDFSGLDMAEIARILNVDIQTIRNDMYCIYAATRLPKGEGTGKKDIPKGRISLDINMEDDIDETREDLIDAFYDDRNSLSKVDMVNSKKYDDFRYCINADEFSHPLYVSLSSEEYDSLVNMLNENGLGERYINMDSKEYYKICPEYNDYSPSDKEIEDIAIEAIRQDRYITFEYKSKDNIISIKPLKVVRHSRFGVSYVVTLLEGMDKIISYRVDRMKNVRITDGEAYDVDMKLLDELAYMWSMDFEGRFDVKIKVYNDNNGKVIDKVKRDLLYHRNENGPVYSIEEVEDGIIMSGKVIGRNAFRAWLRTYGASVEVLEPEELRSEMIEDAKKRLEIYS